MENQPNNQPTNPTQFSLWANILDKFLPHPKKQKFPLEAELNTINRALIITQNHLRNKDYLPTTRELEFLNQLSHELWKNYLFAKQSGNEMKKRLKIGELESVEKLQIDDEGWFLI